MLSHIADILLSVMPGVVIACGDWNFLHRGDVRHDIAAASARPSSDVEHEVLTSRFADYCNTSAGLPTHRVLCDGAVKTVSELDRSYINLHPSFLQDYGLSSSPIVNLFDLRFALIVQWGISAGEQSCCTC